MIIPINYCQINFVYGGLAAPTGAENVLGGFPFSGGLNAAETADLAIAAWTDNIAALVVNDLTLSSVRVKMGPNSTGVSVEVGSGQTGAAGGAGMTPQNALLVSKNTDFGGRKGKGRWFLPGITEGSADESGTVPSGVVAIYQAAFDSFLADMSTGGCPLYLLHADATEPYQITSFAVQSLMATIRDRIRR
jgi:hypothetical protein